MSDSVVLEVIVMPTSRRAQGSPGVTSIQQPEGQIGEWLSLDGLGAGVKHDQTRGCYAAQSGVMLLARAISKRFVGHLMGPPYVFDGCKSCAVKTMYYST